jgi:SagB-type dehydrogenase family enzyme
MVHLGHAAAESPPVPDSPPLIALPKPDLAGKVTLEDALRRRRSTRAFAPEALHLAEAAQLLWAAHGITGPDGKRTTPSARAVYPLEVYLVARRVTGIEPGVYRYFPEDEGLAQVQLVHLADSDSLAPRQAFVAMVPAVLVVVSNDELAAEKLGARAERWAAMEAGFVVQNVYLEATALGLGTVMVGGFDESAVARALRLAPRRTPLAVLPLGHPR